MQELGGGEDERRAAIMREPEVTRVVIGLLRGTSRLLVEPSRPSA
jgi:hypothetical protein